MTWKERKVRVERDSWRRNQELRQIEIKDSRNFAHLSKETRSGDMFNVF